MSDLQGWQAHGPVRTIRRELAEWDAAGETWQPTRRRDLGTFLDDGRLNEAEFYNPNWSVARSRLLYDTHERLVETQFWTDDQPPTRTVRSYDEAGRYLSSVEIVGDGTAREAERCSYDSVGRKSKIQFLPSNLQGDAANVGFAIVGSEMAYGAPGATTLTTSYDDLERPIEAQFHDASHVLVRQVLFTRDHDGRLLTEECRFGGTSPFGAEMENQLGSGSAKDHAQMMAVLAAAYSDGTFSITTHEYDRKGRVLTTARRTDTISNDRSSFTYDDHDNVIEESLDTRTHDLSMDDDGSVREGKELAFAQRTRFEYRYDARGNWTKKIVSSCTDTSDDFARSNVERREFTYYEA